MKRPYSLTQRLVTFSLILSLFLQSCDNSSNLTITHPTTPPSEIEQQPLKEMGNLAVLPTEIVEYIFFYVENPHILNAISLNRTFYKLITSYDFTVPGVVGVTQRPTYTAAVNRTRWAGNKCIDFKGISWGPETIPSCGFYLFVGQVSNLHQSYWSYLSNTNLHTINLNANQIRASEAEAFARNLHGTNVHTVYLHNNNIGSSGAEAFARNLQGTNVHTINLYCNNIGASGAEAFAKNLHGTNVHTIYLYNNNIGANGAGAFARNLHDTNVHTVNLSINNIGDSGAEAFARNLQGTNVHTVILANNNIGASGAEAFARNLQGTNVHTVKLTYNNIGDSTRKLLKAQYPHIKWGF